MKPDHDHALHAILQARRLLRQGKRHEARLWAQRAVSLAPDDEEPWLYLAALASPRASLSYLQRALEINPRSQRARKGMHWAIQRLDDSYATSRPAIRQDVRKQPLKARPLPSKRRISRNFVLPLLITALLFLVGSLVWYAYPPLSKAFSPDNALTFAQISVFRASQTPTPTPTFTPTSTTTPTPTSTNTHTPTPTDTPTETPTPTDTPTETPTSTPTETPLPTNTPTPLDPGPENPVLPSGVAADERWIDVNLSTQRVYAYEGTNLIRSFVVSTGTSQYPTVTGQYRIYIKLRYTNMSGPGYFLRDVPYTMYFYRGYGLHGTYWHSNFGTPMSHGCINLTIDDSAWLFDFASVGTLVNIHY